MRALLIMGPTASGKSALALALAERLGGEIVNADSMQVYRDLRVLTARPAPEEEARAPHHLYGHVDAAVRYSVGAWLREAVPLIAAIAARGRTPIVVGGTGLYFHALTRGLAAIPDTPSQHGALAARLAEEGPEALHDDLARHDPVAAAAITRRDGPRILRALAVVLETGTPIGVWRARTTPALAADQWSGVVLTPPRALLYEGIGVRFSRMLESGALDEARALVARGLDPTLPAMKAHGMPWLAAHVRGEMDLGPAAALAIRDTRRYAKRQYTWIAHQAAPWPRIADTDSGARLAHVLALQSALDRGQPAN